MKNPAVIGAAIIVLVIAGLFIWKGMGPREDIRGTVENTQQRVAEAETRPDGASRVAEQMAVPRAAIGGTVRDRSTRDDIRRRIFAAWTGNTAPSSAQAQQGAPDPLRDPMPQIDGRVDPTYIRDRIREDFVPMAQTCYESLLTRKPGVGGRIVMNFTIAGEPGVGGVVDHVTIETTDDAGVSDGGVSDGDFVNCISESLLTVAFRPPPERGQLTVRYPLTLRPDTDGGAGVGGR